MMGTTSSKSITASVSKTQSEISGRSELADTTSIDSIANYGYVGGGDDDDDGGGSADGDSDSDGGDDIYVNKISKCQ